MKTEDVTEFLNIDLEVFSRESLTPFVEGLGRTVHVLHDGRWGRKHAACVELWASGWKETPEAIIKAMVRLLDRLPRSAKALWNRADRRQFNIGVRAALRPRSFELALGPASLKAISRLNARVVFTVYAPDGADNVSGRVASERMAVERRGRTTRA